MARCPYPWHDQADMASPEDIARSLNREHNGHIWKSRYEPIAKDKNTCAFCRNRIERIIRGTEGNDYLF